MSKILILANSSSGLYDFRNELLQAFLKHHQVIASLPDDTKTELLKAEGVQVEMTPINRRGMNPLQDLRLYFTYRKMLRRINPDLVLTYTIKPNVYGGMACASLGIPYLATVTGLGSAFEKNGPVLHLVQMLYRAGLKKASCVFFQNEENQRIFRSANLVSGRYRLVRGSGVNLKTHRFEPYPEDDMTRFLYVGRMMKEKGIEELLDAAKALHSLSVEFQILGYCDEDYQAILDEREKEGVITQLGFHPDVQAYYKRASAVVMPTYHEGMSNVLMEASATGRPVIATNISGCREVFEEGVTGLGFAPKSSEALIQALKKFLALSRNERAMMGRSALAKMEREFDRVKVVEAYLEEARRALKNQHKEVAKDV